MSASLRTTPRMGVAEFIESIRIYPEEERWELLEGEPVLMAPQNERHQRVHGNLMDVLRRLARDKGCVALAGLGVLHDDVDDYAPIPDVVVRCGPMVEGGYARDPVLVAEVLSPSTMNNDRGRKLDFYRSLATLRTILVVYQDEVRLEAWQREGEGWRREVLKTPDGGLALPELDGRLVLADLYDGVPLPE